MEYSEDIKMYISGKIILNEYKNDANKIINDLNRLIKSAKAEQLKLHVVGITLCGCGGKKYKQRVLGMDFLTCEECGISKPA